MSTHRYSFHIESEDFPAEQLHLYAFEGREAIGQLFRFDIDGVVADRQGIDLTTVVGASACLVLECDGAEVRRIHGMIASVRDKLDPIATHRSYRLTLVPRAERLRMVKMQDVFQDLNIPSIVQAKLDLVGLDSKDVTMRLMGTYATREFVVQYCETDIAFVSRLCEHLGIAFYFDHEHDADRIVFTDHEDGFSRIGDVHFQPEGDRKDVYALELEAQMIPASYIVHDYNYRTPTVDLQATVDVDDSFAVGGVIEYAVHVKTEAECLVLSNVRREEYWGTKEVYQGESALGAFYAGGRIVLLGHPHFESLPLLLTEVRHHGAQPALFHGGNSDQPTYRNTFRAVPGGFTYRPLRSTPRPRIHGLLTGIVEAAPGGSGDLAKIDDEGRYTIRFLFDTSPNGRPKASRPVRMAQPHAGAGYGMHFPLKPGIEVVMAFVDGDPDRPIIVGAVPNPLTPSPVVAANSRENVIRTTSGARIRIID